MKYPLVSVGMITYNHEPYIRKAIDCVLAQKTNFPFELVIGEDCSTDGTREVVIDYAKRYPDIIRVIKSEQNVGMMKNEYRTILACRGKYVAFCEGDDYWHHFEKLQKQVDYLENNRNCALICSDYDILYLANGKRTSNYNRRRELNPSQFTNIKYILRGTPTSGIMTCTVVARNHLVREAIEYNAEIHKSETQPCGDTPMWTELYRRGTIAYINESLSTYREITHSATHNPSKIKILQTSIAMKEQMLYLIGKYGLPDEEKAMHIRDLWLRRLKLSYYDKNLAMAKQAKVQLKKLSLKEWIQYFGAISPSLHIMVKPLIRLLCRDIIPTVPKE